MIKAARVIRSSAALIFIGFLALVLIVGVTFNLARQAQADLAGSIRARDLAGAAVELRYGLHAAESSQRGYLVNGNQIYLAPFDAAKRRAVQQIAAVSTLLGDDPQTQAMRDRLQTAVAEKLAEMEETIRLKREGRHDAAMEIFRSNRGKALMDEINVFLSSMVRHANEQLTGNLDRQSAGLQQLSTITGAAAALILLVVAATLWVIRGFVQSLRLAQEEITAANAGLEQRVQERTQELSAARDRSDMLLAEVNHRVANSLALVASMVGLQSRAAASEETRGALSEIQGRISAVAVLHKKLYTSGDVQSVALAEFLPSLLEQLETSMRASGHQSFLKPDIAPLSLPTDKSVSLGIIVAEWVTNAFKYAYPDSRGEIRVTLARKADGAAELRVEDDGVGRDDSGAPKGTGLGTRLVSALASGLGGRVEYSAGKPGTTARLILPAP